MTTSILARKIMTVKCDKIEFEKVKWLRKSITEEKHKATECLQQILSKQKAHRVCRLCLRPGGTKIFAGNSNLDVAKDIRNVLGIEITEGDGGPQHICGKCFNVLQTASQLKQTAETTQWRLQQELQLVRDTTSDLNEPEPKRMCGGYFSSRGPEIVREWACKRCPKIFHNEEDYNEHEKTLTCRTRSKCYVCEICGREMTTMTLLKRHRLTHSDEPGEYKCKYCTYRGRTKYSLQVHERWHTGDRPLQCPLCAKTFNNASTLWTHKKRHFPPTYHCELCPKSFTYKEVCLHNFSLVCGLCFGKTFACCVRRRRHPQPAPASASLRSEHYSDSICSSSHMAAVSPKLVDDIQEWKMVLVDHIASQHGSEKPFHCDACGKAFATRKKMLRHERRVHNRPRMRVIEKTYQGNAEDGHPSD